jgi:CDP-paratose 2-epimerase
MQRGDYNIGGGPQHTISLLELLALLREKLGYQTKVQTAPWRSSDQRVYISDIRKIDHELGWRPRVSFEEGFQQLLDWVLAHRAFFR